MGFVDRPLGLLGTGIHQGQPRPGVEKAFEKLLTSGALDPILQRPGTVNHGDLVLETNSQPYAQLLAKTQSILAAQQSPFLIGGDHSQAFATISALLEVHPDLKVLWFDAHGDINTPLTSPSGNLHGMPLSGLLGLATRDEFKMPWLQQNLKPENVALVGIRDLDNGEMLRIRDNGVLNYSADDVFSQGLDAIFQDIRQRWSPSSPVHLSFDIDGLDSLIVPATGTPVARGLSLEEMRQFLALTKNHFNIVATEVVEFNPDLAGTPAEYEQTLSTVTELLRILAEF